MKFQIAFIAVTISCALCLSHGYETKYDDVDLDSILKSDRLLSNYVKCLLNEGPCTPDATELKSSKTSKGIVTRSSIIENFKQFIDRLTARRNPIGLLKMFREAEGRLRESNPLFNR